MEIKSHSCKQAGKDLIAFTPPMISTAKQNQINKIELQFLVQASNIDNCALKNKNQELINGFYKIMETNRDLYNFNRKYENLVKKLDKSKILLNKKLRCIIDDNHKLNYENLDKRSQIITLKNLNDKYINENKVLKSKIKKM